MLNFFKVGFLFLCIVFSFNNLLANSNNNITKALQYSKDIEKKKKVDDDIINPNVIQSGEKQFELPPRKKEPEKEEKLTKEFLADFEKWNVLKANPKDKKVCYAVIYATKRIGNIQTTEQEKAYFMVHYFSEIKERVSVYFGYPVKKGSRIFISVDGNQFELTPYEKYAFSDTAEIDSDIISRLLTSSKLLVRGEGDGNTYSVDEYNITGFANAYAKMKTECGPK